MRMPAGRAMALYGNLYVGLYGSEYYFALHLAMDDDTSSTRALSVVRRKTRLARPLVQRSVPQHQG